MSVPAYLALGSNVGDRKAHIDAAVADIAGTDGVEVRAVSSYHETEPVGGPIGQGAFLNAAAAIETTLEPMALLRCLQSIEAASGRVRTVHWGERTLDLDLLLYGDLVLDSKELRIPHPRMAVRRFVLAPLAEVAPGARDPVTRLTAADLLANLDRRPSYLAIAGPFRSERTSLFRRLVSELGAIGLSEGTAMPVRNKPGELFESLLANCSWELRADRWSPELWGDRWVVTDFWFDAIALRARSWLETDPSRWDDFRGRFLEARRTVLRPTFVVPTTTGMGQMRIWSHKR
jgi:2-amino-4-hydroxy-6-hydroxymethyldihydropteridine diphosphokinase